MTETKLADTITELVAPLVAGMGLSLWGLEISFGGRSLVRIFIEKQTGDAPATAEPSDAEELLGASQGVSIDECAELSRLVGLSLEVEDCIPGAFTLEVSSPGLDRTFFTAQQLAGALGQTVDVTLLAPLAVVPDRRKFRGVITAVPDLSSPDAATEFTLLAEDCPKPGMTQSVCFSFTDTKKVKQVYLPPEKALPGKGGGKKKRPKPDDNDAAGAFNEDAEQ